MRSGRVRSFMPLAVGALLLAACSVDGDADDAAGTPGAASPVGSEADGSDEGAAAPEDVDSLADDAATDDGTEPPMTSLVDAALDPDDGWQPDHWDVEVPDEAGTGVLTLGGERYTLSGQCTRSGPIETDDAQRDQLGYFSVAGQFQVDGTDLNVEVIRSYGVPGMGGNPPHFLEFDQVTVGVGPASGIHDHWSYLDGSPWLDRSIDTVTESAEPFVRVDPSGVFTAVGTIEHSAQGESFTGDFELGIRCDSGWVD